MKRCGIDLETLADYRDGRADAPTSTRVRQHLETGCTACAQNLHWLENTTHVLRETGRVEVPQRALDRAFALFRARNPQPTRVSLAERITVLAQQVFDSRQNMALAGARGANASSFQLIFSTETLDVELWQDRLADGNWYLIGQALPKASDEDIVPASVILTPTQGEAVTVVPDAAEFHLRSVPPGLYQITVRLADSDIQLADVQVGQ